jgi:hypothetical protein
MLQLANELFFQETLRDYRRKHRGKTILRVPKSSYNSTAS